MKRNSQGALNKTRITLILAKAGIQGLERILKGCLTDWIPAFAGMTINTGIGS